MAGRSIVEAHALKYMSARLKKAKLEREIEELDAMMRDLEDKHPEIGNLKGMLRRWKVKEENEESEEEGDAEEQPAKKRKTDTGVKKTEAALARMRIQKKLNTDNNKPKPPGAHPRADELARS